MMAQIPGVVFTLDECEKRGRRLAHEGWERRQVEKALADRPYAQKRILHYFDKEKNSADTEAN